MGVLLLLASIGCASFEALIDDVFGGDGPTDVDGDGYAAGFDCDDEDPDVHPEADEVAGNGVDDDCDPLTEDGSGTGTGTDPDDTGTSAPQDADGDGYATDLDCDDDDEGVHPGADELCDDVDQDCDDRVDEDGVDERTFWADYDGDGWGNEVVSETACAHPGSGWTDQDGDCNDGDASIHPEADEICDHLDQDCDDRVDEDPVDAVTYYPDSDHDGYGDGDAGAAACDQPADTTTNDQDCDDGDTTVHPGRSEVCNDGVDNDCDGTANGCGLSGSVSLADADARYEGESSGDFAGSAVTGLGDQDGDGLAEFVVGSPARSSDTGRIYVIAGGTASGAVDASAWAYQNGAAAGDQAGWSLDGSGDADGDGTADLVVGIPGLDGGGGAAVALGPIQTTGLRYAAARIAGADADSYAGWSVALVGTDVIVGAPYTADGGQVYRIAYRAGDLQLSGANGTVTASSIDEGLGVSVANAGDVDGDGVADLIVGSFLDDSGGTDAGAALLFTTPLSGSLDPSDADALLAGLADHDRAGWDVAAAGDVDGDGQDDFLVSAIYEDSGGGQAGATYVFAHLPGSGEDLGDADAVLLGEASGDQAGYAVCSAGDVDGDGKGDVLVGAPYSDSVDSQSGVAHLVSGPMSGIVDLGGSKARLLGESQGDYAGVGVAGPGDLDGDGLDDLLVGAYGWNSQAGAAYVLLADDRL